MLNRSLPGEFVRYHALVPLNEKHYDFFGHQKLNYFTVHKRCVRLKLGLFDEAHLQISL